MRLCCTLVIFIFLQFNSLFAQDTVKGRVENSTFHEPISNVSVLNLSKTIGGITDKDGNFELVAEVGDILYFSYLGYKPFKVEVSNDMLRFEMTKFQLTELAFALEEVVVRPYVFTGYLDIDVKNLPLNSIRRYQIKGLPQSGYEAGSRNKTSISKVVQALGNPADFLYNAFGKNPNQMKKLRKMKEDDNIKKVLSSKYDREILVQLIDIEEHEIEEILRNCNYSASFIKDANDLQILDAMEDCYEEYKILQR